MPPRRLALFKRKRKKMARKRKNKTRKRSKAMKEVMRRRSTTTMTDLHRLSQPRRREVSSEEGLEESITVSENRLLVIARRSRTKAARRETRSVPPKGEEASDMVMSVMSLS